jgi:hypothetical protein
MLGTAAGIAAGSGSVIKSVCLSCGLQYFPGTKEEQRIRALSGQLGAEEKATAESDVLKDKERLLAAGQATDRNVLAGCVILILALLAIISLVYRGLLK